VATVRGHIMSNKEINQAGKLFTQSAVG